MEFYIPPLLEIDLELSALNYYLDLLEEQIKKRVHREELEFRTKITELKLTPDDPEWHDEKYQSDYIVEFLLPRLLRGPFIVSLYAVYESAVTEVAKLIQNKKGIAIAIDESEKTINLDRAKDYYNNIIAFPLYSGNVAWETIKMLSMIRHAIAHKNGRIKMLNKKIKDKISKFIDRKVGISSINGFIVFEELFLRDTFGLVSASLNDLVRRYEVWNDSQDSP